MTNLKANNEFYLRKGFVNPQKFISDEKAKYYKYKFFESIGQSPDFPTATNVNLDAYHDKYDWAYQLATENIILDSVSELLESENIILWGMHFWYKEPNSGKIIPWHQDAAYWKIDPLINVTAWISLDECIPDNGCLRFLPGTQNKVYTHEIVNDPQNIFGTEIKDEIINEKNAVDMIMKPGEFVLFNENTLHGSNKNVSTFARIACSCRFTVPSVKFGFEVGDMRIKLKTVRGVDTHQLNPAFR